MIKDQSADLIDPIFVECVRVDLTEPDQKIELLFFPDMDVIEDLLFNA